MHLDPDGNLRFSPTDLIKHLACRHLTGLNKARSLGQPGYELPPYADPFAERIAEHGNKHEAAYLQTLLDQGRQVTEIDTAGIYQDQSRRQGALAATTQAMRAGADVIYQAVLGTANWGGQADFLFKVDTPSQLGEWSYEVADTKLARTAKVPALVQMADYSQYVANIQQLQAESVHLILGDNRQETFPLRHIAPYHHAAKERFEHDIANTDLLAIYPDKVEHCARCVWRSRCKQRRLDDDHVTLVADLGRTHAQQLTETGTASTLTELATTPNPSKPPRMAQGTLDKLAAQANIQHRGRQTGTLLYELLPLAVPDGDETEPAYTGLEALPEPNPGDLFFDIESDTLLGDDGLEYLFGWVNTHGKYTPRWAFTTSEERDLTETFITFLTDRQHQYPGYRVYHYAPYEQAAIKRLATRHGINEAALDHLLRSEMFVDLHKIVRQALRASVDSYSIKRIEHFYNYTRQHDTDSVDSGTDSAVALEAWIQRGANPADRHELDAIETYNYDDCESTRQLREWLETLRHEAQQQYGRPLRRPPTPDTTVSDDAQDINDEVKALQDQLTNGIPDDADDRTQDQHARWILAQLLLFHRRESNVDWWDLFRRVDLARAYETESDLDGALEDPEILAGLTYQPDLDTAGPRNTTLYTFTFPSDQETKLNADDALWDTTEDAMKSIGTIDTLDLDQGRLVIRRTDNSTAIAPKQLRTAVLAPVIGNSKQRDATRALAQHAANISSELDTQPNAAFKLLTRTPPRNLASQQGRGEAITSIAHSLDHDYLAIQGPPGTGKSTTGAELIHHLLQHGYKVGITANSHAVINNLLTKVQATDSGNQLRGIKALGSSKTKLDGIHCQSGGYDKMRVILDSGDPKDKIFSGRPANLIAGTPSAMSNTHLTGALDYLVIDEAGQMALADALAATQASKNLILLGDPNQLSQPTRAAHPEGTDQSALHHILGSEVTMPPEQGILLNTTYRLHSEICTYISHHFYSDQLTPHPQTDQRTIEGISPGVHGVAIEHQGRRAWSPEEAQAIAELVDDLIGRTFTDDNRPPRPLTQADILVVAPYNTAVQEIRRHLIVQGLDHIRVGTVDKFQGQQTPVAILAMTASAAELAPRGLAFLTATQRLNVAISRAQVTAFVVHANDLLASNIPTVGHLPGVSALLEGAT